MKAPTLGNNELKSQWECDGMSSCIILWSHDHKKQMRFRVKGLSCTINVDNRDTQRNINVPTRC